MVAYNEDYNKKMKAKNEAIAAQVSGGYTMSNSNYNDDDNHEIESSAPLQSIASNDLEEPIKKQLPAKESAKNFVVREARADEEVKLEKQPSLQAQPPKKPNDLGKKENEKIAAEKKASRDNPKGKYIILAGSFSSKENADKFVNLLSFIPNHKKLSSVEKIEVNGKDWWRVHVGAFTDRDKAEKALEIVRDAGTHDAILKTQ